MHKKITLQDLIDRKLNQEVFSELRRDWTLSVHNRQVDQYRMRHGLVDSCVYDMTHDGNDPKETERMLDEARCFLEAGVYHEWEWEKYFIPAINKIIELNDTFERFKPGYVVMNKQTKQKAIVEYDYALGFGGRNFTDLSLVNIDDDGNCGLSWAWADYKDYVLIDKDHTKENIAKVKKYYQNRNSSVPYFLNQKLAQMFYGKPSTDAPQLI